MHPAQSDRLERFAHRRRASDPASNLLHSDRLTASVLGLLRPGFRLRTGRFFLRTGSFRFPARPRRLLALRFRFLALRVRLLTLDHYSPACAASSSVPRSARYSSSLRSCLSALNVAFTTLCGLAVPSDL